MNHTEMYLKDRIYGSLLAGALGDALGYSVEFVVWEGIQGVFGNKGIRDLILHDGKARFSDDTQMTLFTNEGLVLGYWRSYDRGIGAAAEYYVHQNYLLWLKTQSGAYHRAESVWEPVSELYRVPELHVPRAPGNTCISALLSGKMGTIEKPLNASKGCGGVMRTAPCGFLWNFGVPIITGASCAAVTHGHPGGWMPAGILSDIIYRSIYGQGYSEGRPKLHESQAGGFPEGIIPENIIGKPLDEIILESVKAAEEEWKDLGATAEIADMMRRAADLAFTDIPEVNAIHSIGGGWVGDEALAIAIYSVLRHPDDIRECLITAVNHSGDSDSTGAIAGNILGAYLGASAVPSDWAAKIELRDVIEDQADKMVKVIMN